MSSYDTSGVTEMNELFKDTGFNFDISAWNVSQVTSMRGMFQSARSFNQIIDAWDVSSVTSFKEMFYEAVAFNQPIGSWNTASARDVSGMFRRASAFNQPIGSWNTASVTTMQRMFDMEWHHSGSFNQAIGSWNITHVIDMSYMFRYAQRFNQDLTNWNVRGVGNFQSMFEYATSFNGDVTAWDVRGAGTVETCTTDMYGYTYCYTGSMINMFSGATAFNRDVRKWQIGANVGVSSMLSSTRFVQSFKCPNDRDGPPSACYVTPFTSDYRFAQAVHACFDEAFDGDCQCVNKCGEAGLPISKWNTTGMIYMQNLFYDRAYFNQDLSEWNTKSVIRMDDMFRNAAAFNGDLSSWSVDLVRDASNMFNGASVFSGNISNWNLPSETPTTDMFKDADAFNARFACGDVEDGPPNTCAEKVYPSSLVHRLDFSEDGFVETTGGGVVTSFTDVTGKATNLQVFGSPTYERRAHAGLNGVKFSSDGAYLSMTAVGAQEPEVFVVYRVFEYKDKGLIFSHAGSTVASYGFGTYAQGSVGKIGVVRSSGALLATADATTEKWHVANIYFGNTDGFVDVESIDSFDIAGKFDANALAELQVGGSEFAGHDVSNVIGEVLVFDSKLSDSDRASVRQRLMSKWDVPTPDRRWRWVSDGNVTAGSDASGSDQFGHSVSVSGDTMVIGAPYDDDNNRDQSGSVYVLTRSSNGAWTQQQKLTAGSDAVANDNFGQSVSVSGDTVVVGTPSHGAGGSGTTYVFVRSSSGAWTRQQKLKASDGGSNYDYFGASVSVSGDTIIVGAYGYDDDGKSNVGRAYVFVRSSSAWTHQANLTAGSDAREYENFGYSVSVSGDTAVVGLSSWMSTHQQRAYVFVRSSSGVWTQQAKLTAGSDTGTEDSFGHSVSVSGETIVVGAYRHDANGQHDSGSAYVFVRSSSGAWSQQAKLTAGSDVSYQGHFGQSVSISGDIIVVGEPQDDHGSNSNNMYYNNNENQGSAHVFRRSGTKWNRVGKINAETYAAVNDYFGGTVAVSGERIVVGVGLKALNSSLGHAGAAYAFALESG